MSSTHSPLRGIALIALITLGTQIAAPIFQSAYANNTTYYVDASSGSDANDGTTGAWQTVAKVNSMVPGFFQPGDQILFRCGDSWTEQLVLQDSGSSGSHITYGQFGSGAACDGSNKPILNITGVPQISESGSVSYVTIQNLNLGAGDSPSSVIEFSGNGTDITIENNTISNPSGKCIDFTQSTNISITGNDFSSCAQGVEIGDGTATVSGNNFHTTGSSGATVTMNFLSAGTRTLSGNTFSSLGGGAIQFGQNATIEHNIINNVCTSFDDCAAITNMNQDIADFDIYLSGVVNENFITTVGTGINFDTYHQDGIRLDNLSRGVQVTGNTISGAQRAIVIKNGHFHTISNNTLYNPRTYAIHVIEDDTSGSGEVVESNTISNNTILTYNPDYSMVRIEDTVNNLGILATLSGNRFLNVYKPKLPIIEVLKADGDSVQVDKDALTLVDGTATNFTYFGYKTYTSTGVYSGSSVITNGTFGANITGWSTDVLTLSHNAGSGTLHAAQGVEATGTLSSNTFSVATNGVYEVSGWVKNVTNTEGHTVKVRLGNSVGALYADREFDVVATATGTTFKAYVKANTTAADAQLDFILGNSSTDAEFDNIVVRQVAGLTYNSRTNEAVLVSNTGSSAASKACPGLPFCTQYSDYSNSAISWPIMVGAYSSQIVFWNAATQIQNRPAGSLVPSAGSVGNGVSITLTWSASNSLSQRLAGATYTGAFDYSVATSGTMSLIPPDDGNTLYTFSASNDIGTSTYTAMVVTSNTAPINDPAFATGSEDTLSITGVVTSTDVNSGGVINYQLFDSPLNGTIIDFQPDGTFDYRPNPDFCGIDTFTFLGSDFWGLMDAMNPGTVTVTVLCTNDTPVTIDDTLSGTGGMTGLLNVLANDTDPDTPYAGATAQGGTPQIFTITGLTQPANGVVSVSGSYVEFTPNAPYYGPDSFTYMIEDQSGALSNIATVSLTVSPGMNLPPEVSGASYGMLEDTSYPGTFSGSDINGDTLSFTTSVLPAHGVLSIVGSGFTYTPTAHYYGTDSFVFFANDGLLDSSTGSIDFTITNIQDTPVVTADTIGVQMNTLSTLDVLVNDADYDNLSPTPANQGLTITGYTIPSHGTLNLVGNQFQYTSDIAYTGADSFDYIVEDPTGLISNTGTVSITVSSSNQVPNADSGSFSTPEDTLLVNTLSGSDPEAIPVSFVMDVDVLHGTLNLSSTGEFTYMPDLNYNGSDSFTFHVTDGVWNSSIQTVTLDITAVNDLPVANTDTETGTEDSASTFYPLVNDTDVDIGDVVSLSSIVNPPTHGIASVSGTGIVYTPTANYCGLDSLVYQDMDLSGTLSNAATMNINVTCTNDTPSVTDSAYTVLGNILTDSGNTLTAALTGVDIDGDTLTYTVGASAANGTLSVSSTGYMIYTPDLGFSGSDSFTYTIDDGVLSAGPATVTITVNPNSVNLAPTANSDSFSTNEDTLLGSIVTGSDPELVPLTFILNANVTHGTLNLLSSGSFTYTPTANYHGSDSFTFHVNDGINNSTVATVAITVNSVNDIPVAGTGTVIGTEDTNTSITPLTYVTDADIGDTFTLHAYTQGAHGTVSGGPTLTYTPTANYCGSDTITYSAQDQSGAVSNTGNITLNITCVNDVPVAGNDNYASNGTEDTTITIAVFNNDTDIEDGIPVSIANLTQPASHGSVGIVGNNITFSPTANYCGPSTPITFTYQARDSASALSNVATVTIPGIDCVNDIPVTSSASYTMTGNMVTNSGTLNASGNLIGYAETNNILMGSVSASDAEGSSLSFTLATLPATGTASLTNTGYFTYKPALGIAGSVSFNVISNDGTANSAAATITVCVISPDPKVARPSCAPALPAPVSAITSGPGGGGGGGSSSPSASYIASSYNTVISNGTSNELTSQLYLSRSALSGSTSGSTQTTTTTSTTPQINVPIDVLMNTITTIVDTAKITSLSTREGAPKIRSLGRTILSKIVSSTTTTQEEQVAEIETTGMQLETLKESATTNREILSLKHLIRMFYAKRASLLAEIEFLKNLVMQ